ncbi:MAG: RagB/SusD family nutrient uptake outer membrane protein, partial [Cytophagales bacterium]|nr:RagB/SusD family nutrient uptake outer membrane protein [Cytophagales bacterium]
MIQMKYGFYLAGLILLGFAAGCKEEFLDRPPLGTIVDANFYRTNEQVLARTAPLYNLVWFAYNDKASHGIGDARGGVLFSGSYQLANVQMNTTGNTGENESSWRAFYNVVGQCNTAIADINKYATAAVSGDVKQHALAEARFMRGMAYSYLVQNWGEVPIIENNTTLLEDTTISRNTVESVWDFVIRDMRFATEMLPTAPVQAGRLTKWAAEGMLAKMYLTRSGVGMAGTRRQSDLDSAAYFAQRVILNSGKSLMPNYEDLFKTQNNNNQETLFALQWKYDGNWGSQNSVQAYLAYGSSITGFGDGWGGDIGASKFMLEQYEDLAKDKRRKATFMLPGDHYDYIHEEIDDPDKPGAKKIVELTVRTDNNNTAAFRSRAHVKKYVVGRPEDNGGKVQQQRTEIQTYMLRLA